METKSQEILREVVTHKALDAKSPGSNRHTPIRNQGSKDDESDKTVCGQHIGV